MALLREDVRMSYSDIGEVKKIRNLGDKSYSEIQTKVLLFGYERLNDAKKTEFFLN